MHVVLLVAGEAVCRQLVAIKITRVAVIAFDLLMLATMHKLRFPVMVESDHVPFLRAVALVTFCAIAPAMHILQLVAIAANHADALIAFTGMAGFAVDFLMSSDQLEFRLRMIVWFDVVPGVFIMAALAFLTELSFMRFVRLMTIDAKVRRFPICDISLMTTLAARGSVCAFQAEIGKVVIEGFAVELHDIGIASLVLGMAVIAFLVGRIGAAPVKALFLLSVGCDLLVTVHAKPHLRSLRKGLMAILAILFILCMTFNERARHDQPVEPALRLGCG